jgi:putative nucleotidyltransferase with HDIG domain
VIGTHIGNYRIVTELGAGAMGEVYFAEHEVMGRRAAVKIIREELSSNQDMVQRFINEARLVNRIGHPNIVEITDFGQVGSRYYLMMELLEGETLEERLERASFLNEATAKHIALQVADALSAAHARGVVHRDLKPENIYLIQRGGRSDFVKVLDFGIAKLNATAGAPQGTIPGTILGTPHYMSPEQCRGDDQLDHRSDVYALGVVLYRMLTGALPFDGDTLFQVLFAQTNATARPPRELRPEISERVETVVLTALAKDPQARFADMQAMRVALEGEHPLQKTVEAAPVPVAVVEASPSDSGRASDPTSKTDRHLSQRVGSRLARILVERINKDKLVLPSLPAVAMACLKLLEDPDRGMTRVALEISRDPIIASQVIRRARSALLGVGERVRTIEQAVARLGARQLRTLLIELSARRLFESPDPAIRRATRNLWEHSVAVGIVARELARRRNDVDTDVAHLAGLLHDVGKPVAAALLLEAERATAAREGAWLASDAWLGVIAECHREVGVALARSWGLPDEVILAMARCDRYSAEGAGSPASVVCFANALVKRQGIYCGEIDQEENTALIREGQRLYRADDEMLQKLTAELAHADTQPGAAAS